MNEYNLCININDHNKDHFQTFYSISMLSVLLNRACNNQKTKWNKYRQYISIHYAHKIEMIRVDIS